MNAFNFILRRRHSTRLCFALWLVAFAITAFSAAAADTVNIRLGTLVPRGTSYHRNIVTMGEKWRAASGGAVKLTLFPDGTQGSDGDMVGLMQTGNLDAGLLTAIGLAEIEPAVTALQSMPMSFRTLEEVDYVGERLRPLLEARLLAKGYVVLFWTDSGWVRFFSKQPILRPDDLRKARIFAWAGNTREADIWKSGGFHPVALETAGIPQGLMSGTIDVVAMPPFFALAGQLDRQTGHMLDLNWAPLVGAAVVRKKTWDRVPAHVREALLSLAAVAGRQVKADGRAESIASVAAMAKRGLRVHAITPEVETEWRGLVEKMHPVMRGRVVPADMFDEAQRLLKECRALPEGSRS
jgi:TRAP-type C4-dicarboxylate transport system substrate-binding protein